MILVEKFKKVLAAYTTLEPSIKAQQKCKEERMDPNGYCWTHGYRVGKTHTLVMCGTKAPGNKDAPTH